MAMFYNRTGIIDIKQQILIFILIDIEIRHALKFSEGQL